MNSKRRVIFETEKGSFYSMSNGKKTMNPKAKFMKNINQVPKSIRPATKTSKMMSKMKKKTNNMYRTTTTPRPPSSSPKSKASAANRVSTIKF